MVQRHTDRTHRQKDSRKSWRHLTQMYITSVCHCWFGPVGRKVARRGARRALPAAEQVRPAQHAVHGALAGGDDVLVQHHVAQLPVACLGMAQREGLDGGHLVGQQAVIAGRTARQVGKRSCLRAGPPGEGRRCAPPRRANRIW